MNFITASVPAQTPDSRRWASLFVVCLAQLMIVLDVTIVNVALPSIQHDLHFSQANLTWVVNAFLITFGSFLLLAGRLGDLIGRKRVFLGGVVTFTVASLLCGVAPTEGVLIGARFLQGIGAAAQASVILAIIVTEFPEATERARAMSAYVFVSVAGGSLGLLAGGLLTQALSWHWVFFVNLPIGDRHVRPRPDADPRGQGDRLRAARGLARFGARHHLVDERDLRDRPSDEARLDLRPGARDRRGRHAAHGRVHRSRGPHREPDHAPADLPRQRPDQRKPGPGRARHGHVLDLLPGHALPRARPPLQRPPDRRRVPPLDAHGRGALTRDHRAAGAAVRAAPGAHHRNGDRRGRIASVRHDGTRHQLLPDDFLRLAS